MKNVENVQVGLVYRSMPMLRAFLVLVLVLGFPRIYGTEIPMALILVPFYLTSFCRFFFARGWFAVVFLYFIRNLGDRWRSSLHEW